MKIIRNALSAAAISLLGGTAASAAEAPEPEKTYEEPIIFGYDGALPGVVAPYGTEEEIATFNQAMECLKKQMAKEPEISRASDRAYEAEKRWSTLVHNNASEAAKDAAFEEWMEADDALEYMLMPDENERRMENLLCKIQAQNLVGRGGRNIADMQDAVYEIMGNEDSRVVYRSVDITHVKQIHDVDGMSEKQRTEMERVQASIANYLENEFKREGRMLNVFYEGVTPGAADDLLTIAVKDKLGSGLTDSEAKLKENFCKTHASQWQLLVDGKIFPRGAENYTTARAAERVLKKYREITGSDSIKPKVKMFANQILGREWNHKVSEAREITALDRISKTHGITDKVYLVYGAGHEFADNVQEWNKRPANEAYGLKVFIPEGLEEAIGTVPRTEVQYHARAPRRVKTDF